MNPLFDEVIDRRGKLSAKWAPEFIGTGQKELLPFWVADTDFAAPAQVNEAIIACANHGIYGYTNPPAGCAEAIVNWMQSRHNFEANPSHIVYTPGIDSALSLAVQSLSAPGDAILINTPIYGPFFEVPEQNNRRLVDSPLVLKNGKYEFDFEDFAQKAKGAKLWLICNPHNPSARCFEREELCKLVDICLKENVVILSDEIHCDLIYSGHTHIPIASLSPRAAQQTITCVSASKTFSLAGFATSACIIPNDNLRKIFCAAKGKNNLNVASLGFVATQAAYTYGAEYAGALVAYLEENRDYALRFLCERLPELAPVVPEATFLLWIDCAGLGLSGKDLQDFFEDVGVRLCYGSGYREPSGTFVRMNFACPRSILEKGLCLMEKKIKSIR